MGDLVFIPAGIVLSYYLYLTQNTSKMLFLVLFSYIFFATNYTNLGLHLDFDILRWVHRAIGIVAVVSLIFDIHKNSYHLLKDKVILLISLFVFSALASFYSNEVNQGYFLHYLRNLIFSLSIFIFIYVNIKTEEDISKIADFIVLSLLTVVLDSVFGLFQHGFSRQTSFFINPNYMAFSLLFGLLISSFSSFRLITFFRILLLFGIYLSGSRSVLVPAIIFFIIEYFNFYKKTLLPLMGIVFLISFFFGKDILVNRDYTFVRNGLNEIGLEMFASSPINGIGIGQYRDKWQLYVNDDIIEKYSEIEQAYISHDPNLSEDLFISMGLDSRNMEKMSHNDYISIISEQGLIGAISYLLLIIFSLNKASILHREYKKYAYLSIFSMMFVSLFHNIMQSYIFWFMLLFPIILEKIQHRKVL